MIAEFCIPQEMTRSSRYDMTADVLTANDSK